MDFPFHQTYRLDDYKDRHQPCVFFGMYRYEDIQLLNYHNAHAITFLTGQDAKQWGVDDLRLIGQCSNMITAHPKVCDYINSKGRHCQLVKPAAFLNKVEPQKLGPLIYAYCPASAWDYHGGKIIDELDRAGYKTVTGLGQFTQEEWRDREAYYHYKECFIGLCLSEFAGGGGSIIEMGLRGMRVVTNVFDLPNCIPWNSIEDIKQAIEVERKFIGTTNEKLAHQVWNDLDHQHKWLEI